MQKIKLVAIILTFNEAKHLPRCLDSLTGVADEVLIVDCYSNDDTLLIAKAHGAKVVQKDWINHANQFNWGLTKLGSDTDWILRIDADEYLTSEFREEILVKLPLVDTNVDGIYCARYMTFQGRMIRYGGVCPIRVLRLFRYGRGECENRWMDEHIKVEGYTINFTSGIIDDNLNSLTWWTDKHNKYASREVIDLLNIEYAFMPRDSIASLKGGNQASVKRWLKEMVYARLPTGIRAFTYFFYRYVLRLGFLDGREGASFHFLQGFWYRYLVDAKLVEVKRHKRVYNVSIEAAIERVLGIKI
jgi:glycosyltransferase involved in cell wall biosynthesis